MRPLEQPTGRTVRLLLASRDIYMGICSSASPHRDLIHEQAAGWSVPAARSDLTPPAHAYVEGPVRLTGERRQHTSLQDTRCTLYMAYTSCTCMKYFKGGGNPPRTKVHRRLSKVTYTTTPPCTIRQYAWYMHGQADVHVVSSGCLVKYIIIICRCTF